MQPQYHRRAGNVQERMPYAARNRVPADCPVLHHRPDQGTVSDESGREDTGFDFHFLRYPSVKITDSKKVAMRWTNQNGKSLVYFNRDLRCGRKLILRVESVEHGPDFGLIFGVTTCGPSQVFDFPYHLVDYCRPEYDCCGHSVWMKLRHFNRVGSYVVIERVYDAFIRFTFDGRFKKDMCDPPERGFGRSRAYPFLMLTGSVTSVRILPAVPVERPSFNNRPPALQLDIAGLRLSPQDHSFTTSAWISNRNVSVNGLILRRSCATGANRNYVFSSRAFAVGKTLQFQIRETDNLFPGTITFGVTTYAPDCVSLDNLPINSSELTTNRFSKNWYLSQDIIENTHLKQCLSVRRMPEGFTIKTGFKQIRYLFYVDPLLTVYPFFNFNGAIRSIELVSNSAAAFSRTPVGNELRSAACQSQNSASTSSQGKCVICLDERADHMAVPCNHVAFCQSCSTQSMTHGDGKCPLCRKDIDRISKIFLA